MASDQVMGQGPFDMKYFLSGALAGGICCSITHGGLVPVDVVKTKIQLQPDVYNKGFIGGFGQVIEAEGMNGLLTGLGPTAQGYFIQGWFKFGGVEFFKINITKSVGEQKAWDNRNSIYLASSAMAEFIADIFLCPYEACRIRLVSDPAYADSMVGCASKMMAEQGFVGAFYSGFVPILCKQIPYTMAKFAVQGKAAENIYNALGSSPDKPPAIGNLGVSLASVAVWKSTSASGAPDNSSLSHFGRRAVRNRHRHAIEQASRRWRGGRRDDSARPRRKILISTQVGRHRRRRGSHYFSSC